MANYTRNRQHRSNDSLLSFAPIDKAAIESPQSRPVRIFTAVAILLVTFNTGCGLVFQAGTRYREHRMLSDLQAGETMGEVRQQWGEPDIIDHPNQRTEVWSYAARPNSNDPVAFTVYTSAKSGDAGTFLDLTMVDGKLASWTEGRHTLPSKERGGYGFNLGGGGLGGGAGASGPTHY